MSVPAHTSSSSAAVRPRTIWDDFREGSDFFMQEGAIYETLRRLAARLREEGIEYALIDGMALVAHGVRRFTEDVGLLLSRAALVAFSMRLDASVRGVPPPVGAGAGCAARALIYP